MKRKEKQNTIITTSENTNQCRGGRKGNIFSCLVEGKKMANGHCDNDEESTVQRTTY